MKIKVIAALLLLAMLVGTFGCAMPASDAGNEPTAEQQNLLTGGGLLGEAESAESEEAASELLNIASCDGDGDPLFQIVYNITASLRVKEQCEALAADIYNATGVTLPVVHSMEPQTTYEVTVGDIKRPETIELVDQFVDIEENDFAIGVIGTRLVIYAKTDHALVSAVLYFMDALATRSELQRIYGIEKDHKTIYHPSNDPQVTVEEAEDGSYVDITLQENAAQITYVRLTYTGNKAWRIQTKYRKVTPFRDTGAAQLLAYTLGEHTLGEEDERFYTEKLHTAKLGNILRVRSDDNNRVDINLESFGLKFYTSEGEFSSEITSIISNAGGSTVKGTLNPGEAIFGTGERFNGVNQRGKEIEMFTKDIWSKANACYMAIPLLCFSRGAGVFINNYEHMMLDLDSKYKNVWSATVTGAPLDCYVYATTQMEEVIHGYSRLSGYASMPEEWTYGMIVCAYSPDLSQKWSASITPSSDGRGEGVYEMIANMETYDLPWTGVLAEGWGAYTASKHQDLRELCDYVHSLGKKFLVYMRVGNVSSSMKNYRTDYLLTQTRADGEESYRLPDTTADTNNPDVGTSPGIRTHVYLDITNPMAVNWFFDTYWDFLSNEIGVDGCKIDFCETLPENFTLNYFDKNVPTAGSHHWYPTAFCTMFYDMISSKPDSGMCYTRGGGIGSQRAPFMWAGDQMRCWDGLDFQISAMLSSGLSGVPYMSYDMSGYQYGSIDPGNVAYEAAVFLRGTQFSAYTVCIQTHGKVKRSYQFAEYTDENGAHPYRYVTDIYRAYTKLHEHLTPYITELCEDASTTGLPVMRHLVLGWQDDKTVYPINDEFMMGDAFLIAPITDNSTSRRVYLPAGVWEDLNTGAVHDFSEGGAWIDVSASIAEVPTFFNRNTESETARELVSGIKELYDYARTFTP